MTKTQWKPIRKIVAAAVGAGVAYVALRLGVDLGEKELNQAVTGIVAVLSGYFVRN